MSIAAGSGVWLSTNPDAKSHSASNATCVDGQFEVSPKSTMSSITRQTTCQVHTHNQQSEMQQQLSCNEKQKTQIHVQMLGPTVCLHAAIYRWELWGHGMHAFLAELQVGANTHSSSRTLSPDCPCTGIQHASTCAQIRKTRLLCTNGVENALNPIHQQEVKNEGAIDAASIPPQKAWKTGMTTKPMTCNHGVPEMQNSGPVAVCANIMPYRPTCTQCFNESFIHCMKL